ncbi:MAG: hypothetical protein ACKV22_06820 [Bryobacteraceae bacterium]
MIASSQEVVVPNRAAWDQLPDGRWEVVEGRAILSPPPRVAHQLVSDALVEALNQQLKPRGLGRAISAAGIFVPPPDRSISEVQSRIPGEGDRVGGAKEIRNHWFPSQESHRRKRKKGESGGK